MANDMVIMFFCLTLFIGMGVLIPFIQAEVNDPDAGSMEDVSSLEQDIKESYEDNNYVSFWKILASIFAVASWSFGMFPVWVDIALLPLKLTFWGLLARNIWIGGGS